MAPQRKKTLPKPLPEGFVLTDTEKKKWRLGKIIGQGGFGLIYLGNEHTVWWHMHTLVHSHKYVHAGRLVCCRLTPSPSLPDTHVGSGRHFSDWSVFLWVVKLFEQSNLWRPFQSAAIPNFYKSTSAQYRALLMSSLCLIHFINPKGLI